MSNSEAVLSAIANRKSCKKFDSSKKVDDTTLEAIVEAGLHAANGMGKQGTHLVVVQDPETVAQLSQMNAAVMGAKIDPFYGAQTVVVVLADASIVTNVEDGALVMGNLLLAASAMGVGACWIHRAREVFASDEGKALLAKWGIEGEWIGVGHCILGYPAEGFDAQPKAIKEGRVTYVK